MRIKARVIKDRRRDIRQLHRRRTLPHWRKPRHRNSERHVERCAPGAPLLNHKMIAKHVAVIGCKNDHCLIEHAALGKHIENPRHLVVDQPEHRFGRPSLPVQRFLLLSRHRPRAVLRNKIVFPLKREHIKIA